LFAAMSAAETNAPEVTATLFSFRTPLVASVEMTTPAKAWPSTGSVKPKSAAVSV
jgi:hypothetical protein